MSHLIPDGRVGGERVERADADDCFVQKFDSESKGK